MAQDLELAVHTFPGRRPVLLIHGFTRSAELDWIEPGWADGAGPRRAAERSRSICLATDRVLSRFRRSLG